MLCGRDGGGAHGGPHRPLLDPAEGHPPQEPHQEEEEQATHPQGQHISFLKGTKSNKIFSIKIFFLPFSYFTTHASTVGTYLPR